ncbi:MAG: hypothetical protein Q9208_004329 [Pyrenodesmia sp. 3 TL-2023]
MVLVTSVADWTSEDVVHTLPFKTCAGVPFTTLLEALIQTHKNPRWFTESKEYGLGTLGHLPIEVRQIIYKEVIETYKKEMLECYEKDYWKTCPKTMPVHTYNDYPEYLYKNTFEPFNLDKYDEYKKGERPPLPAPKPTHKCYHCWRKPAPPTVPLTLSSQNVPALRSVSRALQSECDNAIFSTTTIKCPDWLKAYTILVGPSPPLPKASIRRISLVVDSGSGCSKGWIELIRRHLPLDLQTIILDLNHDHGRSKCHQYLSNLRHPYCEPNCSSCFRYPNITKRCKHVDKLNRLAGRLRQDLRLFEILAKILKEKFPHVAVKLAESVDCTCHQYCRSILQNGETGEFDWIVPNMEVPNILLDPAPRFPALDYPALLRALLQEPATHEQAERSRRNRALKEAKLDMRKRWLQRVHGHKWL